MFRHRDRLIRQTLRVNVVVTLTDGSTFDGVLADADEKSFVLVQARFIHDSVRAPQPVDGAVIIDRSRVAYTQRPEGLTRASK